MASYDELVCHCNRTVILPPIACGRTFDCTYPCVRPPPACGHPKVPHSCHESERCPPCVFLTERECACGKNTVKVRFSFSCLNLSRVFSVLTSSLPVAEHPLLANQGLMRRRLWRVARLRLASLREDMSLARRMRGLH